MKRAKRTREVSRAKPRGKQKSMTPSTVTEEKGEFQSPVTIVRGSKDDRISSDEEDKGKCFYCIVLKQLFKSNVQLKRY